MAKEDTLSKLRKIVQSIVSSRPAHSEDRAAFKEMLHGILSTRPDEIDCDECFEQLDRFAEMILAGQDVAQVMPLVQDHLERCRDCCQEFEALLAALRAVA